MKVLVTGHEGYIGGVLVPMLLERGHEVIGCDTNFFAGCLYQPLEAQVENLSLDVRDLTIADLEPYDAIIHLAGLSNDPLGNFNPELTTIINQVASEKLAENAKKANITRFIFASSCSNYGAAPGVMLDETASFNPQTIYGQSKCNAEATIHALASEQFVPCSLRAGTVYGVAPRIRFDLVVNNLTAYAVSNGEVLLKSDGKAWRPLVHVSDVARAYVAVLEAPSEAVCGESFNVGRSEENYQIIDVARMIEEVIPDCRLTSTEQPIHDTRNYRVNCDKIATRLNNYHPQWILRDGIEELYTALRASPVSDSEFEGAKYNRLAHLRDQISAGVLNSQLRAIKTPTL